LRIERGGDRLDILEPKRRRIESMYERCENGWCRRSVASHLDAKHPVKLTEVGNLDVLTKPCFEALTDGRAVCGNGAVVYMDGDDDEDSGRLRVLVENCLVDLALGETEAARMLTNFWYQRRPACLSP
jgi:hypothetical protein